MAESTSAAVETNGTADHAPVNRVRGVKAKPAGSFLSRLHALADKNLSESTMVRGTGPDGLPYTVRVPAVPASLTTDDIAAAAKGSGARVRVSSPDGSKSSSWGVSGENAAETVRRVVDGE
jgi:hypothetical protein